MECSGAALPQSSNFDLGLAPTPINVPVLEQMLIGYPKTEIACMLYNGFAKGFTLNCEFPPASRQTPRNLKSIMLNPEAAQRKIDKEVRAGNFGGPWPESPIHDLIISLI